MIIKFLGTSGYMPTDNRHTNCIMLPDEGIVFDAGTGFYRVGENLKTKKLNILLSHYHPDHIHGLTFMLGMFYDSKTHVSIYGPEKIHELEKKLCFPVKFKDHPFKIELKKIKKKFNIDDIAVETMLFPHADEVSAAYRIEKGNKVLCYLTDITASDDEIDFVKDADMLIHECYFDKNRKELAKQTSHSYTTKVAEIAKKANVKLLVLHHLSPLIDDYRRGYFLYECLKVFENTTLPKDNQEFEI